MQSLLAQLSFSLYSLTAGYFLIQAMKPPRPVQADNKRTDDRLSFGIFFMFLSILSKAFYVLVSYQALVVVFPPPGSPIAFDPPSGHPLNHSVLTWNLKSATMLTGTLIGALGRLRAYAELGRDFTYELKQPSKLKTDGLYRYVRHPSYLFGLIAWFSACPFFIRLDGPLGTLLPASVRQWDTVGSTCLQALLCLPFLQLPFARIPDEEKLMKKLFGKQWEQYCARTWKLIPGIY